MSRFLSYWSDILLNGEKDFSPSPTEQVGYRSVQQQVNSFLQAGQRLDAFRRGLYDYDGDVDDFDDAEELDPTSSPDFDEIDAQRILESVEASVKLKAKQTPSTTKETVENGSSKNKETKVPDSDQIIK